MCLGQRFRSIKWQDSYEKSIISYEKSAGWSWFCNQINIEVFYTLVLKFLVGVVRPVPIANQIAELLEGQYLQKHVMDCLNILHE